MVGVLGYMDGVVGDTRVNGGGSSGAHGESSGGHGGSTEVHVQGIRLTF